MPWVMRQVRTYPCFDYLRFAVVLVVTAMILDLGIVERALQLGVEDHPDVMFVEELLEALGGFSLCFASLSIHIMHCHEEEAGTNESEIADG